ncbi:uncharacterized protein [Littorina saxatilis]|uniref:uncharacterized protein n=1 Tax=Littorina saxatilis TaxID=31220 RepID=UPI0038B58CB1
MHREMWTRLQPFFFVLACINTLTGALYIRDCASPRTHVPGVVDNVFYCDYSDYTPGNITWTVAKDNGTILHLGTCTHPGENCGTSYPSATLRLLRDHSSSRVTFYDSGSEFNGKLTCTEYFATGAVKSDSCSQRAIGIRSCQRELGVNEEYGSTSATCYHHPRPNSTVAWTVVTDSGHTVDLGTCSDDGNCTSLHPSVTVSQGNTYSRALMDPLPRNMSGQLFCSCVRNGVREADNMTLVIYNHAAVDNCSFDISQRDWTAILSCDVTRVFVSTGEYEYRLHYYKALTGGTDLTPDDGYLSEDRVSYRDALTPYTDSTNNQTYYRGRLVISWPLPDAPFYYSDFEIELGSGLSAFTYKYMNDRVTVSPPSRLTHNCTDLNLIPGSRAAPCFCSADSLGSPPGRLLWLLGDTVMATGEYNVRHLQLPSDKMGDRCDGLTVTCQLDWVKAATLTVTKHETCEESQQEYMWVAIGIGSFAIFIVIIFVIVVIILCRRGHHLPQQRNLRS